MNKEKKQRGDSEFAEKTQRRRRSGWAAGKSVGFELVFWFESVGSRITAGFEAASLAVANADTDPPDTAVAACIQRVEAHCVAEPRAVGVDNVSPEEEKLRLVTVFEYDEVVFKEVEDIPPRQVFDFDSNSN